MVGDTGDGGAWPCKSAAHTQVDKIHISDIDNSNISLAFARVSFGSGHANIQKLVELHGGDLSIQHWADGTSSCRFRCHNQLTLAGGFTYYVSLPLGSGHLGADALAAPDTADQVPRLALQFGHEVIDDMRAWRHRDDSTDQSASSQSGDSSTRTPRGVDPSTLYFTKDDVIMVVDGASSYPL